MPFIRPTLSELISRVSSEISSRLEIGPLLQRSVLFVLSRVFAGLSHLWHGHIDWGIRQLFPTTADTDRLDGLGDIWGVVRKPAAAATGSIRFTGTVGTTIDAGTQAQRADGVAYRTTVGSEIESNGASVVQAEALEPGADGNINFGVQLTLTSSIPGINSVATVEDDGTGRGMSGGSDRESDDAYRSRIVFKIGTPPLGGSAADYVHWAREVSGVSRAWCIPLMNGPGTVGVTFAVDEDLNGPIPSPTKVAEVAAYIEARRPVAAIVSVFAPVEVEMNPQIHIEPDNATVRKAVEDSLKDLILREGNPGETLLLSHIREAISAAAGEVDSFVISPVTDIGVDPGDLLTLGTVTWS